jgi:hypothetical protein
MTAGDAAVTRRRNPTVAATLRVSSTPGR